MTPCSPGDIVLVRFPFTDLSQSKKRPALIISPKDYPSRNGDVVLLPITGVEQESSLALSGWKESGLLKPSWVKPLLATVSTTFVFRALGALADTDYRPVDFALGELLDHEFRSWQTLEPA